MHAGNMVGVARATGTVQFAPAGIISVIGEAPLSGALVTHIRVVSKPDRWMKIPYRTRPSIGWLVRRRRLGNYRQSRDEKSQNEAHKSRDFVHYRWFLLKNETRKRGLATPSNDTRRLTQISYQKKKYFVKENIQIHRSNIIFFHAFQDQ
jgi:hypothetical protein